MITLSSIGEIGSGLLRSALWELVLEIITPFIWDFTIGLSFLCSRIEEILPVCVCVCVCVCHVYQGESVLAAMKSAIVCSYISFSARELWN